MIRPYKLMMLSLLVASQAAASYEKGLQLVLLQCLSDSSVSNLVSAIKGAKPAQIEISSAPYILNSCAANHNDPLGNLATVTSALVGAHISVRITVYLDPTLHDRSTPSTMMKNMQTFYARMMKLYVGNSLVSFRVGGSLEDNYASNTVLNQAFDQLLAGLTSSQLSGLGSQMVFRRSPEGGYGNSSYVSYKKIAIRHESHGGSPSSGDRKSV